VDLLTLLGIAVALAMDAFAVALATALVLPRVTGRHLFRFGFHFGLFQALMPVLGWLAGLTVQRWLAAVDHWIAFALLGAVGGRMLWESRHAADDSRSGDPTRGWSLVALSVATSLDALAVGLTLAMLEVRIWFAAVTIGLVAGGLTLIGMTVGRRLGRAWGPRVEVGGGLLLIGIGAKILVEHLIG
jgi:putative Mn2+ efflux pump MntP